MPDGADRVAIEAALGVVLALAPHLDITGAVEEGVLNADAPRCSEHNLYRVLPYLPCLDDRLPCIMYRALLRTMWTASLLILVVAVTPIGGHLATAVRLFAPLPARAGELRLTNVDLYAMLLPTAAVPVWLYGEGEYPLPNEEVARYFVDSVAAERAMTRTGRMNGAAVDYRLPGTPRESERAVLVISSVAWYSTVAGAEDVIQDPTLPLVIHRFGLHTAEVSLAKVGEESRTFRGYRDGDDPNRAAYLIVFRKANIIGTVVVVMSEHRDDGGELVGLLAHKQQALLP